MAWQQQPQQQQQHGGAWGSPPADAWGGQQNNYPQHQQHQMQPMQQGGYPPQQGGYPPQQQQQQQPQSYPPPPAYSNAAGAGGGPMDPWNPPAQGAVGSWPAPSAMPARQDSWGLPPAQDSWVAMQQTTYDSDAQLQQQQQNRQVVSTTQTKDTWTSGERCNIVFAWIFTLACWFHFFVFYPICIPQRSSAGMCGYIWTDFGDDVTTNFAGIIVPVLVYFAYLGIVCRACPVRTYLNNILPSGVEHYLRHLQVETPQIEWYIRCYHSESRGSGKNRRTVQVTTHTATYFFPYDSWWDVSKPMPNTGNAAASRIRTTVDWKAADQYTGDLHNRMYEAWIQANDRDVSKQYHCLCKLNGQLEQCLSLREDSCLLSSGVYWIFSLLCLNPLYQHYFYTKTVSSDFECEKIIRRVPRPDDATAHTVGVQNPGNQQQVIGHAPQQMAAPTQ